MFDSHSVFDDTWGAMDLFYSGRVLCRLRDVRTESPRFGGSSAKHTSAHVSVRGQAERQWKARERGEGGHLQAAKGAATGRQEMKERMCWWGKKREEKGKEEREGGGKEEGGDGIKQALNSPERLRPRASWTWRGGESCGCWG